MAIKIALAGNPNSGKTTLFNNLTGSNAHVGNWPGVTVERKEGRYKGSKEEIQIIDLPGIYSLSPYTAEEIVARDFLANESPDLIINIVDATNIERNLYLTTQLLELGIPTVVALNMMDEVKARGDHLDVDGLSKKLGVPVMEIVATRGKGVKELMAKALEVVHAAPPVTNIFASTPLAGAVEEISKQLSENGYQHTTYYAVKLLEKDEQVKAGMNLQGPTLEKIDQLIYTYEKDADDDLDSTIADLRYQFITKLTAKTVKKGKTAESLSLSDKIDKVVTNRWLGIPIFVAVMYLVFQVSLGPIGAMITDPFAAFFAETVPEWVGGLLESAGASELVTSLVMDGIIAGISGLLGFLPLIVLLFLCLSLLEDIGYMARIAFIMDRVFRRFGLSGKAFVPLLMGYGCSIPAIMATRTLEDEKSRRLAITLMPFMSCGARIPVYAVFVGAFFAEHQAVTTFSIYMLGIIVAMISSIVLNKTVFKGEAPPFVMELPPYRLPTLKAILVHTWEKAKGYLVKVGTILVTMTVVIWFCQSFSFSLQMVDDPVNSIFGTIGSWLAPLFTLNGFGRVASTGGVHWQIGAALLAGLVAKEAVVSTLGILYINEAVEELTGALGVALTTYFTPLSAYALMVFVLLYAPCFAAIATAKKELGSWKWTAFTVVFQCGVAWLVSMLVYQVGSLLGIGLM